MDIQPFLDEYERLEEYYHIWAARRMAGSSEAEFPEVTRLLKLRKLMDKAGVVYTPA